MRWLVALPVLAALAATALQPRGSAADRAARRGVDYLWQMQGADGGWHSRRYGVLKPGHSLTALCLLALAETPGGLQAAPAGALDRACDFLRRSLDDQGSLGTTSVVPDYPNYATALAVLGLQAAGRHPASVARMRRHLAGRQLAGDLGFRPEHVAYGAWGFGGRQPRQAPDAGHVDLSMTRHVIEALAPLPESAATAAMVFLERCRNADGGFLFSPVVSGANKAAGGDRPGSYGTATADGVLALLASGVSRDDPRLLAAARWLREHHRLDRVPGLAYDGGTSWATGLRLYYMAASSRAFAALGPELSPAGWRRQLEESLIAMQRLDGSWANPNTLVKEDDPLLATALALRALAAAGD